MYKVGDRVRLTQSGVDIASYRSDEAKVGTTGTIVHIDEDDDDRSYLVRLDVTDDPTNGSDAGWWFTSTQIEPVTSTSSNIEETTTVTVGDFSMSRVKGEDTIIVTVGEELSSVVSVDDFATIVKTLVPEVSSK